MTITLKLTCSINNEYIINFTENTFTFEDIYNIMKDKGITDDDLSKIRMFYKGNSLLPGIGHSLNPISDVLLKYNNIIYIFTNDVDVKANLIKYIFTEVVDTIITDYNESKNKRGINLDFSLGNRGLPIKKTNLPDIIETITPDICEQVNNNIIHIFKDNDFVNLLNICINKPHLLEIVNSYILNGNITRISDIPVIPDITQIPDITRIPDITQIPDITRIPDITQIPDCMQSDIPIIDPSEFIYNDCYTILQSLNIIKNDNMDIKSIIQYFKGHLNYVIRYILYKQL